ncbi:MAG: sugar phosphate nucleotidyltransferase [Candidatus Helarchaeota archaeon]
MKAVIIAGGKGTRLRPITSNIPKPLVRIINEPMLVHLIKILKQNGFNDIIITVGYLGEMIKETLGDGSRYGVKLSYFFEERPLGTAGALKLLRKELNDTFLIISSDIIFDVNLREMLNFHKEKKSIATLALTVAEIPVAYGIVITENDGKIIKFLEKPTWGEVFSDKINAGIYLLEPKAINYIPEHSKFDFSKDLFPQLLENKENLYGFSIAINYWLDIGTPEKYLQAHHDILTGKVKIAPKGMKNEHDVWIGEGTTISETAKIWGPVIIGENCHIDDGAIIDRLTVLGDNCYIGKNVHIKRSLLLNDVSIRDNVFVEDNSIICSRVDIGAGTKIMNGCVIGEDTKIGSNSFIKEHIKIWPDKTIKPGSTINLNVKFGTFLSKNLFGPFGITGIANVEITPEIATKIGAAIGTFYKDRYKEKVKAVVGRDSRIVSRLLKRALIAGLMSTGIQVYNVEIMPLPLIAYAVKLNDAHFGIAIKVPYAEEASINIKVFEDNEINISNADKKKIEKIFFEENIYRINPDEIRDIIYITRVYEQYIEEVKQLIDVDLFKKKRPKIILDCEDGSGSFLAPNLLTELGCEVISINAQLGMATPIKKFSPKMESISVLMRTVKAFNADLGIALNEDAGRVIFIDDNAQILEGDTAVALLTKARLREFNGGKIIVPVHTSTLIEKIASEHGGKIIRTKIGNRPLLEDIVKNNAIFGAEPSGAFVFPDFHVQRDGIFAAVYLIQLMLKEDKKLSEIIAEFPNFYMARKTIKCPLQRRGKIMLSLIEEAYDHNFNTLDGIKIYFDYGWVLIRPSEKDDEFDIFSESRTKHEAEEIVKHWADEIQIIIHELETGI